MTEKPGGSTAMRASDTTAQTLDVQEQLCRVIEADRRFFARRPERRHRFRQASIAEIEEAARRFFIPRHLAENRRLYVLILSSPPHVRLRFFGSGRPDLDCDVGELFLWEMCRLMRAAWVTFSLRRIDIASTSSRIEMADEDWGDDPLYQITPTKPVDQFIEETRERLRLKSRDADPEPPALAPGWDEPFGEPSGKRPKPFALIPFGDVNFTEDGDYLVAGLLPSEGLAIVYGAPKQYKTYVISDALQHVARGTRWAGRTVRQGAVVYIVAEGARGFRNRIATSRIKHSLPADLPFFLIEAKPNLGAGEGDVAALKAAIEPAVAEMQTRGIRLAAICIDTVARTLAGAAENDEGLRNFADNAEALADHFKCLAVGVHHSGKDAGRGMRGHSSLPGAVVTSWKVEKVRKLLARVTLVDSKDGESGLVWECQLDVHEFARDRDGNPRTSLFVSSVTEPVDEAGEDRPPASAEATGVRPVPPQLRLLLSALDEAVGNCGRLRRPFVDGPNIKTAMMGEVRAEYDRRRGDATPDARRKSFTNSVKSAVEREMILVRGDGDAAQVWRK